MFYSEAAPVLLETVYNTLLLGITCRLQLLFVSLNVQYGYLFPSLPMLRCYANLRAIKIDIRQEGGWKIGKIDIEGAGNYQVLIKHIFFSQ